MPKVGILALLGVFDIEYYFLPFLERVDRMIGPISCDWLTVSEVHAKAGPMNPSRFIVDAATGEVMPRGLEPVQLPGLLGSSVRVWSDGLRVQVSGNPSRWNRSEAVFGLSVDDAKRVINGLLVEHGFPPFSDSAVVSRVDLTRNLALGPHLSAAQRILQTFRYGRLRVSSDGDNVYWGAHSRKRQLRAYAKGPEVRSHVSEQEGAEREYLLRVSDWLIAHGVLRVELELARSLASVGVRRWADLSDAALGPLYEREVAFMSKAKRVDWTELEDVPIRTRGLLMLHFSGLDLRSELSASAFYRVRKELLAYGYDISKPVTKPLVPKAVHIEMRPLEIPDFMVSRLPAQMRGPKAVEG